MRLAACSNDATKQPASWKLFPKEKLGSELDHGKTGDFLEVAQIFG